VKIDSAALGVLRACRVEGSLLFLPGQLERQQYEAVNKVLEAMGGKWKRAKKAHQFEWDIADQLADVVATGEVVDWRKTLQFYETPAHIAASLVDYAEVDGQPELRILEPSAGRGAIARVIAERMDPTCTLVCIEKDPRSREILLNWMGRLRGKDVACQHCPDADFLQYQDRQGFDRIIANPPFAKLADVKHAFHMWELLAPGGILVSVMSAGAHFREDRPYQEWRELLGRHGGWIHRLPDKAFSESGTDVATVMTWVKKQGARVPAGIPAGLPPLFQQYWAIKREYPDVLLLFRIGDFYELFGSDAETGAAVLEITLTSRDYVKGERIPMCGVPHHSVDRYVARLIAAGYRVALCDQVDPEAPPAQVPRKVQRVITPGQPDVVPDAAPVPVPEPVTAAVTSTALKADTTTRNGTVYPAPVLEAAVSQGSFDF
jgi:16S rRNA G966 N2-methylase RsmD